MQTREMQQSLPVWLLTFLTVAINVIGFSITGIIAFGAIVVGATWRILVDWWAGWIFYKTFQRELPNPACVVAFLWPWAIMRVCYGLLGVRQRVTYDLPGFDPNKPIIVESNHPTIPATIGFAYQLEVGLMTVPSRGIRGWFTQLWRTYRNNGNMRFVIKSGHLFNPFGLGIWAMGVGTFINRKNRHKALAAIQAGRNKALRRPHLMFIFPDQHRPTAERREEDISKYRRKHPNVASWLVETLFPRPWGTYQMLHDLPEDVQVVSCTCTFDAQEEGVFDIPNLIGSTLHLDFRWAPQDWTTFGATDPDDQLEELRSFQPQLLEVYLAKNRRIYEIKHGDGSWAHRPVQLELVRTSNE